MFSYGTGYLIVSDGAVDVCDHQLVLGSKEEHPEGQLQPQPFSHILPCKLGLYYTVARWQKCLLKRSNVAEGKKVGGRNLAKFCQKWQKKNRQLKILNCLHFLKTL